MTVVNIIAVLLSPIIAVLVTQAIQARAEKRKDKMTIFRTLMAYRGLNWGSIECVNSLNTIEIVFCDDQNVVSKWKDLYDKLCVECPTQTDLSKIEVAKHNLLDAMAESLGYAKNIDWNTIQHPYVPNWINNMLDGQQRMQDAQLIIAEMLANGNPFAQSLQQSKPSED